MEKGSHVQNVVEYDLYPNISFEGKNGEEIKLYLIHYLDLCMSNISLFLVDYIWQRDSFHLTPVVPTDPDDLPHLHGVTDFGDNIDDEWFIVLLLYQLTAALPQLVASIRDGDGEFLLIEAAYHLPKWLEPETSSNRVFIYNGDLHIIPKPNSPAELVSLPAGVPSKSHAVEVVRKQSHPTLAKTRVREAVRSRVDESLDKAHSNVHLAHCLLPAKLAAILKHQPGLISPAVEAFYLRDPIDLKACRVMKNFPPEDLVTSQVKFTRCLYAQLVQQSFQPDRRSGWKLPSPSSSKFKSADLGMKLAHGFEILCSRFHGNKKCSDNLDTVSMDPDDLARGARWQRFLKSLTENGFFKGELEGSKLYKELLQSAKQFYASILIEDEKCRSNQSWRVEPGEQVLRLLETVQVNITELKKEEENLPPPDSDRWMELSLEELDEMIAKASGKEPCSTPSSTKSKAADNQRSAGQMDEVNFDPSQVTESLKSFVDAVSGLKGAEFPGGGGKMEDITFDPDEFEKALANVLGLRVPNTAEDSDSDSDLMRDKDYQSGGDTDNDEEDEDVGSGGGSHDDERILELMEQMDRELARTEVGKSFEREGQAADDSESHQTAEEPNGMDTCGPSHSMAGRDNTELKDDEDEKGDEYRPVEVDVNLLKNILESYSSQQGLAGPASNLLHSMGIHVPLNADDGDR